MDKKTVKTGIAGAGFSASFHYEALKKVYGTDVDIKGVYALAGADEYAAQRGIKAYKSLEAMLDDVDVVHVCVTADSHESVTIETLKRDKYAIVEKPLTGYFGEGTEEFHGDTFPKQEALDYALESISRMLEAEKRSKGKRDIEYCCATC